MSPGETRALVKLADALTRRLVELKSSGKMFELNRLIASVATRTPGRMPEVARILGYGTPNASSVIRQYRFSKLLSPEGLKKATAPAVVKKRLERARAAAIERQQPVRRPELLRKVVDPRTDPGLLRVSRGYAQYQEGVLAKAKKHRQTRALARNQAWVQAGRPSATVPMTDSGLRAATRSSGRVDPTVQLKRRVRPLPDSAIRSLPEGYMKALKAPISERSPILRGLKGLGRWAKYLR